MTAVLGDYLEPVAGHLATAISFGDDLPIAAARGVVRELSRVTRAMARYLADLELPDDAPRTPDSWIQSATTTRLALRRSALHLQSAAGALARLPADDTHPAVTHLSSAADLLAAGQDLLHARQQASWPGPIGGRRYWAAVATSPPVTTALLAEITGHARTLAPWAAQLSATLTSDDARLRAHDAARWLYAAAGPAEAWKHQQALPAQKRRQLHVIPVDSVPRRQPPAAAESVPALCAGITSTADRLRYAARAFAPHARTSPAASSRSWRRHALGAAITSHAIHLILDTLAERATQLDADPALRDQIRNASAAAARSWPAWRAAIRHWDTITTATRADAPITPVAAELDDLVLRTGRLAFASQCWTPATAQAGPARQPADLAPAASNITEILAALHHAADTLTLIAATDYHAISQAARDSLLYMPTRLRPEDCDTPYRYTHAPASQAQELLASYDSATQASTALTTQLDELSVLTGAHSQILAAPRRNPPPARQGTPHDQRHPPIRTPPPGQLEGHLHALRITEPDLLAQAQLADAHARDILARAAMKTSRRHATPMPRPHVRPPL